MLQPWLCGGPLVNLDGEAIGLNIARAGRVTTYALPARANAALHVAGDGVAVPVVRWLARAVIEPLLERPAKVMAAE